MGLFRRKSKDQTSSKAKKTGSKKLPSPSSTVATLAEPDAKIAQPEPLPAPAVQPANPMPAPA